MADERDDLRKTRVAVQWVVLLLALIAALLAAIVFGIAEVTVAPG